MFILDGCGDFADATERLARLMHNIECGSQVFGWKKGSTAEPLAAPAARFLSITVPGGTASAPPTSVEYRPTVAFIYYIPTSFPTAKDRLDLKDFVGRLDARLKTFPADHLAGFRPVEQTAHATLLATAPRGANTCIHSGIPRSTGKKTTQIESVYYSRVICFSPDDLTSLPGYISTRGVFTWLIVPVGTVLGIPEGPRTSEEFNALVASVFFDTEVGGGETGKPVYELSPDYFGIAPPPSIVTTQDFGMCWGSGSRRLVYKRGCFDYLPDDTERYAASWRDPSATPGRAEESLDALNILNVPPSVRPEDANCFLCLKPLWGEIYAISYPKIEPAHIAACLWCCGLFSDELFFQPVKTTFNRTLSEAYRDKKIGIDHQLFDANIEMLLGEADPEGNKPCFLRVSLKDGTSFLIEPGVRQDMNRSLETPPCLRRDATARAHKLSCVRMNRLVATFGV